MQKLAVQRQRLVDGIFLTIHNRQSHSRARECAGAKRIAETGQAARIGGAVQEVLIGLAHKGHVRCRVEHRPGFQMLDRKTSVHR